MLKALFYLVVSSNETAARLVRLLSGRRAPV